MRTSKHPTAGARISARWRAVLGAICLSGAALAGAQDFILDWSGMTAGGGQSSGGDFDLSASVGEPDAGPAGGGDFALQGGFWSGIEPPGAPSLSVRLIGGELAVSWTPESPSGSTGFALQATPALRQPADDASWATLSVTPELTSGVATVRLPIPPRNQFYRLRRP